jgi:hypothetical protein
MDFNSAAFYGECAAEEQQEVLARQRLVMMFEQGRKCWVNDECACWIGICDG